MNKLGFPLYINVPPVTKWGGLLLLWKTGLDLEPIIVNSNVSSIFVYLDPPHNPWLLKFVYCPTQHSRKNLFWENMNNAANRHNGPMLAIGDFNSILSQTDKYGGRSFVCTSIANGLRDYMEKQEMVDLGFHGPKYTWTNNRFGLGNIRDRLDRGIANHQWMQLFPNATLQHLPINPLTMQPLF